jgi:endonuclease YncB( thermonuclease family)
MRRTWGLVGFVTVGLVSTLLLGAVLGSVTAANGAGLALPADASYLDIPIQETGTVDAILDGDTFRFREDGANDWVKIRLLGVNTPEVTGFNNIHFAENMCGGQEALHLLDSIMPPGTRVQLRSNSKESSNRGRALRYAFALNPNTGKYDIDVQAAIAESGLAMWFTIDQEAALAYPYRLIIQRAQRGGRGIWDPNHCGPREQPDASIKVTVSWDAPGVDQANLNGEFVILRNTGSTSVDLSGWLLRDSSLTAWFYFPPNSVLTPGDYRVLHVGSGTPGSPHPWDLYMNSTEPLFPNLQDGEFVGDGAYLLDRKTAVRFYDEYPCITDCSDPLTGVVTIAKVNPKSRSHIAARAANEEFVILRNSGATPVLLDGYFLRRQVSTYPFPPGTTITPGGTLTVRVGTGSPTSTIQYWGRPSPLLNNQHDRVELLSNRNVLISQRRW